jgi:hypothetical protein
LDNIKTDLKEIGYDDVHWIHRAKDGGQWLALLNTVMNYGPHTGWEVSWLVKTLLFSQDGIGSVKKAG